MWEQHCDKKVQEIGFKPIGEEWPSMYFHDKLRLLLVIYADDLKLAGPTENLAKVGKCCVQFYASNPKLIWVFILDVYFPKARPNYTMERKSRL